MGHRFEVEKRDILVDQDRQYRQPAGRILDRARVNEGERWGDLGCGVGYFTLPLAERGVSVIALDAQRQMLDALSERLDNQDRTRVCPVLSEMPPIALRDDSLDRAILVNVLHEVEEREFLSSEVLRILRPGGRLTLIDFPLEEAPFGPPLWERLSPEEAMRVFGRMTLDRRWDLCGYYHLELRKGI
ncbi:MAG: class I SAM-dependent methyltransferase [Methanomassiliicoccales archaeon]